MALPSQIDAAARTPTRPTGDTRLDLESPLLSMTRRQRDEEQQERRRAIACVRRMAGADAALVLDVLGLIDEPPEPTEKTCTRCRSTQPIDQFQHPIERRRTTQCLTCRTKYSRPKEAGQ